MNISIARRWFTILMLLAICGTIAYGQRRRMPASSPSRLTGMKIIPYSATTDSFAEDAADSGQAFFNELDVSFLVKVEVSGKAGEFADRNVQITAREGSKLVLSRVSMVGVFNEHGKYYVTAWIYGPLCQKTVVQASLLGRRPSSTIKKTIAAMCGE